MRRFFNVVLVTAFLVIIGSPLTANLRGKDGGSPEDENRELAPFPTLAPTWTSMAAFGTGLDVWFQDHFGFRSTLVRWHGVIHYFWLHVSPSSLVIRGKDDWLFYADDGGLDDFTHDHPLPAGQVDNWRQTITRARDWCRAHGIAYVLRFCQTST
jgi:hypothetical protein